MKESVNVKYYFKRPFLFCFIPCSRPPFLRNINTAGEVLAKFCGGTVKGNSFFHSNSSQSVRKDKATKTRTKEPQNQGWMSSIKIGRLLKRVLDKYLF